MAGVGQEHGIHFFKPGKDLKTGNFKCLNRVRRSAGIGQVDHQIAVIADRANARCGAIACAVAANHFDGAIRVRGRIVQRAQRLIKIEIRQCAFNADAERRAIQRRGEVGKSMDMRFASAVVVISVVMIVMSFVIMILMIVISVIFVAMIFVPMIMRVMVLGVSVAVIFARGFSMILAIMIGAFRSHSLDLNLYGFFDDWGCFRLQSIGGLLSGLAGGEGERARSEEEDRTRHFRLQLSFDTVRCGEYFAETF